MINYFLQSMVLVCFSYGNSMVLVWYLQCGQSVVFDDTNVL